MATPREGSYAGTHGLNGSPSDITSGNSQITGRVLHTLLTDDPKQLSKMKVPPGSIGAIQFKVLYNGQEDKSDNFLIAYPLGNIKKYPVQNELVNIVTSPSNRSSNPSGNNIHTYYYDDILPVFDSPEHNALPTDSSFSGSNNTSVTGPNFKERGSVYKLQHLPGDTTIEGRFGNSIRIGSSNDLIPQTPWKGTQGNPIFVVTNGQKPQTSSNISAVFEDINGDGSSIWGLSGHSITFVPASTLFDSYNSEVTSTDEKNNIIVASNIPTTTPSIPAQVADKVPVVDTVPVVYSTNTPPTTVTPVADEPLPTKEDDDDFNVEFEDLSIPHQGLDQQPWIDIVSSIDIVSYDPNAKFDLSGNFNPLFLVYMYHNQGPGGIQSILYYAKQGASKIPVPAKYSSARDRNGNYTDINDNMFGRNINPSSKNRGNVGDDFKKYYGTTYTPLNFLKYWNAKVDKVYKKQGITSSNLDAYFSAGSQKYGIPIEWMRTIAYIESSYVPTRQSHGSEYKGLFQINIKEFQAVYPSDTDILNPMKNSIAGAKAINKAQASVSHIIQSLK